MTAHEAEASGLTCREAIGLLADYLESALTQAQLAELEAHLAECEPCQAYLNTYRRTKALTAQTERVEMPAEMRRRLSEFLIRHLPRESR
jgi:anti-sigma factor RsiW